MSNFTLVIANLTQVFIDFFNFGFISLVSYLIIFLDVNQPNDVYFGENFTVTVLNGPKFISNVNFGDKSEFFGKFF